MQDSYDQQLKYYNPLPNYSDLQMKIRKENEELLHYLNEWSQLFIEEYSKFILNPKEQASNVVEIEPPNSPKSTKSTTTKTNNSNKPYLTIRNNKIVYSVSKKGNRLSSSQLKTAKETFKRGKRGSKYRGVSRNGNQWQVLIMINKRKKYMGNYSSEEKAARIYDQIALQYHGRKAKTNFLYSDDEVMRIIEKNECKVNISQCI